MKVEALIFSSKLARILSTFFNNVSLIIITTVLICHFSILPTFLGAFIISEYNENGVDYTGSGLVGQRECRKEQVARLQVINSLFCIYSE